MKVVIDQDLKGKELFAYLVANKSQLVAQKKSILMKWSDPISFDPEFFYVKGKEVKKTLINDIPADASKVRVKIVANTAMWMDSQKDVLLPDCWAKSIKDGKGRLHLKDHTYKIDAEIGDVVNVYSQDLSLSQLGINKAGTVQALIYESDVQKSYDERAFNKYKAGRINQHSIGLNYVSLQMAINDEDYKEEFANWNKYISQVINKSEAEKGGFFWVVPEIKLIEVSAVLMGANELTPTLEVGKNMQIESTEVEPEQSTIPQPFDWKAAIKETNFLNFNS